MLILFSQLRKWRRLRRRRMREATTTVRLRSQADVSVTRRTPEVKVSSALVELSPPSEAMLRNIDARRSALSEPVQRHQTPLVDIQGCKRKAVLLILAVTPGKVLRTKPQNLLIRLPIQNLEAVA